MMSVRVLLAAAFLPLSPALADGVGPPSIEAAGVTFPAIVAGDGAPVVFVHGMLADDRAWAGLAEATAAEGRRFVAYTQRGFGPGSSPDEPFSRDRHIADLAAILRTLDAPADLVAWSYGGAVALGAAAAAPDRVRRIVLYEPYVPELSPEADAALGERMGATAAAMDAGDIDAAAKAAAETLLGLGEGGFAREPAEVQAFQRDNAPSFAALWKADPPTPIACQDLEALRAPVLIVTGSTTLPGFAEMSKAVAACLPAAQSVVMEGQGHGGPAFARDAFGALALDFIDGS